MNDDDSIKTKVVNESDNSIADDPPRVIVESIGDEIANASDGG